MEFTKYSTESGMVVWAHHSQCFCCLLSWLPGWLGAADHCIDQHHARISYYTWLAWEKNQNSEFQVWLLVKVYHFSPWESWTIKSNHHVRSCKSWCGEISQHHKYSTVSQMCFSSLLMTNSYLILVWGSLTCSIFKLFLSNPDPPDLAFYTQLTIKIFC